MTNQEEYQRIYDEFVGKGKIQPISIIQLEDGTWSLIYQEGKFKHTIVCESRDVLEEVMKEFGGKNPDTCKTDALLLAFWAKRQWAHWY